jgi:hypothetical protein
MANLLFEVNTSPMAQTVDSVKAHVNGVTTAVVAMESALIAAERLASETICKNVDNGFYMLIKSQISQKAVSAYTEMATKQMTLLQLVKALENVKQQMEADYNMISARYAKLFQSLNKALETRVRELDRPAMKLAEIRKNIVFDKLKDESSLLLSSSGEVAAVEQIALSGKLKQKTRETLKALSSSIAEDQSYSKKVNDLLSGEEAGFQYIPALFSVTESLLNPDDYIENVYAPQSDIWKNTAPVASEISRVSGGLGWGVNDKEKSVIRKEFVSLCENEVADKRVAEEIIRLFDESSWEVCENEL